MSDKNKVLIIINGGVAQMEYKPDNIEVEIRDYDVEGSWDEDNIACKKDDDGDEYQEMVFPATEIVFHATGDNAFTDEPVEVEEEEDYNYHITILHHDISYYLADNSEMELGDSESEHIEYMIGQGCSVGELNKSDKDGNDGIRGFWKIVKN